MSPHNSTRIHVEKIKLPFMVKRSSDISVYTDLSDRDMWHCNRKIVSHTNRQKGKE